MATIINGFEKSPCICAKAKYALGIENRHIKNKKKCSDQYWSEVIKYYAKVYKIPNDRVLVALERTDLYK